MDSSSSLLKNIFDKTGDLPPQNLEAEQTLLGAMLISPQAIADVGEILQAEDFYRQSHRHIFQAISELYASGEPADAITISEKLNGKGFLEEVGGKPYIHTLISSVPTPGNAIYYAEIVRRCAVLRQLLNISHEIAGIAFSSPEDVDSAVDQAEELIFSIARKSSENNYADINTLMHEIFEDIHEAKSLIDEDMPGKEIGLPTGFKDFDRKIVGLHPSDLIIVAGRPSMGKTSFALNIAQHVGLKNIGVAIFSLEMSRQQLAMRMLCSDAEVDAYKTRTGYLSNSEMERLQTSAGKLSETKIYIDDSPSLNPLEIRAKARRLMAKHNIGLIIVDYLQLMHSFGFRKSDNREQEVSQISRSLKTLGRELHVPIIAISQLSRAVEKRDHKRPMLSDLRESGAIEQDADLVVFIYKEEEKNADDDDFDDEFSSSAGDKEDKDIEVEIDIAKHRNGPTGKIQLLFRKRFAKFVNLEQNRAN
jgi:replicative DNA helicase